MNFSLRDAQTMLRAMESSLRDSQTTLRDMPSKPGDADPDPGFSNPGSRDQHKAPARFLAQ